MRVLSHTTCYRNYNWKYLCSVCAVLCLCRCPFCLPVPSVCPLAFDPNHLLLLHLIYKIAIKPQVIY